MIIIISWFIPQGTFKIPKPLATLRQPAAIAGHRNIGLMRPSSGYYSYNVKRLDSDSESGRCSSNNVSNTIYVSFALFSFCPLFAEPFIGKFERKSKQT